MPDYMIAVICTVAVSGIIMSAVFHRLKVLNFRTVASVTLASLITAVILPGIFNTLSASESGGTDASFLLIITISAFVAYMFIVFILSVLISCLVPKIKTRKSGAKPLQGESEAVGGKAESKSSITGADAVQKTIVQSEANRTADTEQIIHKGIAEEVVPQQENASEAAVESEAATALSEQAAVFEAAAGQEQSSETAAGQEQSSEASAGQEQFSEASAGQEQFSETAQEQRDSSENLQELLNSAEDSYKYEIYSEVSDEGKMEADQEASDTDSAGDNYLEQIYLNFIDRNDEKTNIPAEIAENTPIEMNNEEKSVDSAENIDKMGIENNIHDSEAMTIEECIDEAFRLREQGDHEGSILYFMYALDKKPQKGLTFWIILDICVMYKSIGQMDLALDILNSYYDIYGDSMENEVKEEIVKNLTEVSA